MKHLKMVARVCASALILSSVVFFDSSESLLQSYARSLEHDREEVAIKFYRTRIQATLREVAEYVHLDEKMLQKMNERTQFSLQEEGHLLFVVNEEYVIFSDERLYEYDVFKIDVAKELIEVIEEYDKELLNLINYLRDRYTHTHDEMNSSHHAHGHEHAHEHNHAHEHAHAHSHEEGTHTHDETNSSHHAHGHEHGHEHNHAHEHAHAHSHEEGTHTHDETNSSHHAHGHEHAHEHNHAHEHDSAHSHEEGTHTHDEMNSSHHAHGHEHNHEHNHAHEHDSAHSHEEGTHTHTGTTTSHNHAHEHDHTHAHDSAHSHEDDTHTHTDTSTSHDHGHAHDHSHPELEAGAAALEAMGIDPVLVHALIHSGSILPFPQEDVSEAYLKKYLSSVQDLDLRRIPNALKLQGLEQLENIELLGLSRVTMESEDLDKLRHFKKLKTLWLPHTQLSDYSFISQLPTLEALDLSFNPNIDISFLKNLPNLKQLKLMAMELQDDDVAILADLPQLETIELDSNRLTHVDFLKNHTNLKALYISGNQLLQINGLATQALEVLYVNDNQLTEIPQLSMMKNIKDLNVANNQLTTLAGLHTENLVALNAKHNTLKQLNLSHVPALQSLDVSHNHLIAFSAEQLTQLKYFYASYNQLESLDLSSVKDLRIFHADNNRLKQLNISPEVPVEVIYLEHNQLDSIDSLRGLPQLNEIYVSHNNISSIAGWIEALPMLGYVDLAYNQLSNLEELTVLDPNLFAFDISGNPYDQEAFEEHLAQYRKAKLDKIVARVDKGYLIETQFGIEFIAEAELTDEEREKVAQQLKPVEEVSGELELATLAKKHYVSLIYNVPIESVELQNNRMVFTSGGYYYAPEINAIQLPSISKDNEEYTLTLLDMQYVVDTKRLDEVKQKQLEWLYEFSKNSNEENSENPHLSLEKEESEESEVVSSLLDTHLHEENLISNVDVSEVAKEVPLNENEVSETIDEETNEDIN